MIASKLYPFHSLLWEYHIWYMPTFWGMQPGHKTRPGHANMCFLKSFLQHFISEWLAAPTFIACTQFTQVPYVPGCPLEVLGNIRHLCEWGTSYEGGAIICHVEYITPSFLTFFQFGENTEWIMDGFAPWRTCARCVDIDRSCTKAPWV